MAKEYNILSLFDGLSGAQLALKRANIKIKRYFACEIDKYAIMVTQKNFPDTTQLGDVTKIKGNLLPKIDLLIGGSPCQGFSFAGGQLNFNDPRSMLVFEYFRILKELKKINPEIKFLLENVPMAEKSKNIISKELGVEPILINSSLVSAQQRKRLYWTNINGITQPKDRGILLKNILQKNVSEDYNHTGKAVEYMNREVKGGRNHWDFAHHSDNFNDKSACVTANMFKGVPYNVLVERKIHQLNPSKEAGEQPHMQNRVYHIGGISPALTLYGACNLNIKEGERIRKLTPVECERLQTIPDNYTSNVSETQRYKMIGNGFTIDVITHILNFLKWN